jgi:hypothetical protein
MAKMKHRRFVQPADMIIVVYNWVVRLYVKAAHAKHIEVNVHIVDRQHGAPQLPLEEAIATGAFVAIGGSFS